MLYPETIKQENYHKILTICSISQDDGSEYCPEYSDGKRELQSSGLSEESNDLKFGWKVINHDEKNIKIKVDFENKKALELSNKADYTVLIKNGKTLKSSENLKPIKNDNTIKRSFVPA